MALLPCLRAQLLVFTRSAARLTSKHAIPLTTTAAPVLNHSLVKLNERESLLGRPGILGIKREMISWFTEAGEQHAATVIEVDACEVLATTRAADHGFLAVQVGHIDKLKNVPANVVRMCEAAGVSPKRHVAQFRVRTDDGLVEPGTELRADYFAVGQLVDVEAVLKGKGFAGVMKRHGFKGLRATHGVSVAHRSAGSMGATQDPGRVLPGKKMAGRMGGRNCTVHNNEVLHADGDAGILVLKGQVPGPRGAFVKVRDAKKLYGRSLLSCK